MPPELHELVDFAECALDEQLEHLHRCYATASRAAARARSECEALEQRDDNQSNNLEQVRRQRSAAEIRSLQILRAIDALETRDATND